MPSLFRSFLCSREKRRQEEAHKRDGAGPASAKGARVATVEEETKDQQGDECPDTSMTTDGDEEILTTQKIMELLKDLWSDDKSVIVRALTQIANIGFRDVSPRENERKIRILGGHTTVFQVLQKYVGCFEIQKQGICALGNLAQLMPTKKLLGDIGCVEVILARMKTYRYSERIQWYGCSTLRHLVSGMKDNAERVEQSGGIGLIVAAMKAHPNNKMVQDRGCMALANMSEWDEYRPLIIKAGGASPIASIMDKYKDEPQLRDRAYKAMEKLFKKPAR
jgi:hypothetical protein